MFCLHHALYLDVHMTFYRIHIDLVSVSIPLLLTFNHGAKSLQMFFRVLENTIMPSDYIMHHCKCKLFRNLCISLWNAAHTLVKPNSILSHSQKPNGPTVNTVSGLLASSILTCQYTDLRSSDVKLTAPLRQSNVSWILDDYRHP